MLLALDRWFAGTPRRTPQRETYRSRLTLSRLEDRTVPTVFATGAGAGSDPIIHVYDLTGGVRTELVPGGAQVYGNGFTGGVTVAVYQPDLATPTSALIVTGAGAGGGPHVRVFSIVGNQLRPVYEFFAYDSAFLGGVNVAMGDVNGDGVGDVISGPQFGGGPHVRVFNGATAGLATPLLNFFAAIPSFTGGITVGASDFGGDNGQNPNGTFRPGGVAGSRTAGTAEIVTGTGVGGGSDVRVWDFGLTPPANLQPVQLADLPGVFGSFGGGISVSGGFVTNNVDSQNFVYADIVVSANQGGGPAAKIFRLDSVDNATNTFTYVPANVKIDATDPAVVDPNYPGASFFTYDPNFGGGSHIGVVPDTNNDQHDEIITGPGFGGGPDTRVRSGLTLTDLTRLFSGNPADINGIFVG